MYVCPYVFFNDGVCREALTFYEKAFDTKALVMRYGDAPPSDGFESGPKAADLILHANLPVGDSNILLCDSPPGEDNIFGNNFAIMVATDTREQAEKFFNALKEGGAVYMELTETFWSKAFGMVKDKFGLIWQISLISEG